MSEISFLLGMSYAFGSVILLMFIMYLVKTICDYKYRKRLIELEIEQSKEMQEYQKDRKEEQKNE